MSSLRTQAKVSDLPTVALTSRDLKNEKRRRKRMKRKVMVMKTKRRRRSAMEALRRMRRADHQFKTSRDYIERTTGLEKGGTVHVEFQFPGGRGRRSHRPHWPANLGNQAALGAVRDFA